MTIAITAAAAVGATLLLLFLFSATYRAGMRKGGVETIAEIRRAIKLAGLQNAISILGASETDQTIH